jgi:hypothetical protein
MMGHRHVGQAALFYEFSLEQHIPRDHLLRSIDRLVELGDLRRDLAPATEENRDGHRSPVRAKRTDLVAGQLLALSRHWSGRRQPAGDCAAVPHAAYEVSDRDASRSIGRRHCHKSSHDARVSV